MSPNPPDCQLWALPWFPLVLRFHLVGPQGPPVPFPPTFPLLPFLLCHKSIWIHWVLEHVPGSFQALRYFTLFLVPRILCSTSTSKLQFTLRAWRPCQPQREMHHHISVSTRHASGGEGWGDGICLDVSALRAEKAQSLISGTHHSTWKQRAHSTCI